MRGRPPTLPGGMQDPPHPDPAAASQDELLQALQGLVLQLQALADGLPAHDRTRDGLERVMGHADALLARASAARPADLQPTARAGLLGRLMRWWQSGP